MVSILQVYEVALVSIDHSQAIFQPESKGGLSSSTVDRWIKQSILHPTNESKSSLSVVASVGGCGSTRFAQHLRDNILLRTLVSAATLPARKQHPLRRQNMERILYDAHDLTTSSQSRILVTETDSCGSTPSTCVTN